MPAGDFDMRQLKDDVTRDRNILRALQREAAKIRPEDDPKLGALIEELVKIAEQAEREAADAIDAAQKRKVLIFSYFADTVTWIKPRLDTAVASDPRLSAYRGRITIVAGSAGGDNTSRDQAVHGFAPISTAAPAGQDQDLYDILVSTDVLAEGMNLQQCRHIVNYDMPWNPMRLVQRHGRIDRIGSPHPRAFLRTIFPHDRLDALLDLEGRILNKLAQAAASIGLETPPIERAAQGRQVFTEARDEIERLAAEDPSLFERGGTASASQSGEEYRQELRKALQKGAEQIKNLPWKAGSGMVKGKDRGVFFCALIADRTYLRFVPASDDWRPANTPDRPVLSELGTCLRMIECGPETPRRVDDQVSDAVYDFWAVAHEDIYAAWDRETDPANTQPKIRPLNRRVADFIRANIPQDIPDERVRRALDILESPWPRREEVMLRHWFEDGRDDGNAKARRLIAAIIDAGLEPFMAPPPLPPITTEDIQLVCWLAITPQAPEVQQSAGLGRGT